MAKQGQPDYLSYLLRLWRVNGETYSGTVAERTVWRASLESPYTHERWGFVNLKDLFDFLSAQTCSAANCAKPPTDHLNNQIAGVEEEKYPIGG